MAGNLYVIAVNKAQTDEQLLEQTAQRVGRWGTNYNNWTGNGTIRTAPHPLFKTEFEKFRNNIVPRFADEGTGLPVLIDWAYGGAGDDHVIWQTLLPNSGNQAPGVSAGCRQHGLDQRHHHPGRARE